MIPGQIKNQSSRAEFEAAVTHEVANFPAGAALQRLDAGRFELKHYHALLLTLFHQTYSGPYLFALAASTCSWRHESAKEYLLQHAEEERTHWRWVLEDLKNTGYSGLSPRELFPHTSCEAFISFNERVSREFPVARLAIASVLEGIGNKWGTVYGRRLVESLQLDRNQAKFFISHGVTDQEHIVDLQRVIDTLDLDSYEWGWMTHAASVGGAMYRAMYSHESFA